MEITEITREMIEKVDDTTFNIHYTDFILQVVGFENGQLEDLSFDHLFGHQKSKTWVSDFVIDDFKIIDENGDELHYLADHDERFIAQEAITSYLNY